MQKWYDKFYKAQDVFCHCTKNTGSTTIVPVSLMNSSTLSRDSSTHNALLVSQFLK